MDVDDHAPDDERNAGWLQDFGVTVGTVLGGVGQVAPVPEAPDLDRADQPCQVQEVELPDHLDPVKQAEDWIKVSTHRQREETERQLAMDIEPEWADHSDPPDAPDLFEELDGPR